MTIALDGSAQGSSSASTTVSASLTTAGAGLIIAIVQADTGAYSRQYPSVVLSDAGGKVSSWKLQYEIPPGFAQNKACQVWYGVSSGSMSANSFTATFLQSQSQARLIVFGVSGANTSKPFDTDSSIFPGSQRFTSGFGQTGAANAFNTSCTNAMIVGVGACVAGGNFDAASPSGFAFIQKTTTSGGPNIAASYKVVSATQSGIAPQLSTNLGSGDCGCFGFAIAAAGETNCSDASPQPMIAAVNNAGSNVSGTTIGAALTTQNGNGLIFAAVCRNANQSVTMSDGASAISGWTKYLTANVSTDNYIDIWYGIPSGALSNDTITATLSGAVGKRSISVFHVPNVNRSAPFDTNGSLPTLKTGSGFGTMSTNAATTTAGNVLVLVIVGTGGGAPATMGSPLKVISAQDDSGGDVGVAITWSQAALSAVSYSSAGLNGTGNWQSIVAALHVDPGGFTGTLAATDGSDVAAFTGTALHGDGTLAATEGSDVASFTVSVGVALASLAATEAADLAHITGYLPLAGTLAATEADDVSAIVGNVPASAALAATEAADVPAFTGQLVDVLAVSEARDTASFIGLLRSRRGPVTNLAMN